MRIKDVICHANGQLTPPQKLEDHLELTVPIRLSQAVSAQDADRIRQAITARLASSPLEVIISTGMKFTLTFTVE